MNQLSIFSLLLPEPVVWQLFIDGAARNNPGPAGAGIYIIKNGVEFSKHGFFLGSKTNNQAEYLALLLGLLCLKTVMQPQDKLIIKSDSELLVRQLNGVYSIKNPELKRIATTIKELLSVLRYTLVHVRREENSVADCLANKGIDKKVPIDTDFLKVMDCLL
ncbi:ribonuclease HI family protein [Candidatus Dependentiae bacterium]|nr:ribonuclease HI family protein [Candidatus Dependentiae bacterium]